MIVPVLRQPPSFQLEQCLHGVEWECDYADWQTLYSAVDEFLGAAAHRTLTDEELELLRSSGASARFQRCVGFSMTK